ncbi:MAG: VWA domain-containing protein [Actinobacteria bacterium]|nr:VWA domain-containing protein [Actinomycetota bacterium]
MENSELYTVFPVFMLVDVSASMAGGPIEAVNAAMPDLKKEMLSNPSVGEIARVCVVTFSDVGRTVIPLCDFADAEIPEIMVEGGTNFAAAFREVKSAITKGLHSLPKGTPFYRPVVFFMSDGEHQAKEEWDTALDDLKDKSWKFAPEIVCFGFGDANRDTTALRRIATRFAFLAKETDPVTQVREIMNALLNSIRTTSTSFGDPTQAEGLHIEAPAEHFAPLPKMSL